MTTGAKGAVVVVRPFSGFQANLGGSDETVRILRRDNVGLEENFSESYLRTAAFMANVRSWRIGTKSMHSVKNVFR